MIRIGGLLTFLIGLSLGATALACEQPAGWDASSDLRQDPDPRDLVGVHVSKAHYSAARDFLAKRADDVTETFVGKMTPLSRQPIYLATSAGSLNVDIIRMGQGLAVPEDFPECAQNLIKAESIARRDKSGIWSSSNRFFSHTDTIDAAKHFSGYNIVFGRVHSIGKTRSTTYLNFGPSIKKDFSAVISSYSGQDFDEIVKMLDTQWKGLVEVRGTMENYNGAPRIHLTSPYQIRKMEEIAP